MNRKKFGITEKRLNDKRFKKTEEAILRAFFDKNGYITVMEIAKKVGVTRSTIYGHHRVMREIVKDYKKFILKKYNFTIKNVLQKKRMGARELYTQIMFFIIRNQGVFKIVMKENGREVFISMIDKLKPELMKYMRIANNYETMYGVYKNEVATLLEKWGEGGFKKEEIESVLKDIIYLTDTARVRLLKLEKN